MVLLDAYSPYFAFWLMCVCGIPSVTLTGTVEDWRRIRGRVDALAGFGLETWCRSLAPIADAVRPGRRPATPDREFWQRIYNPVDAYGGARITGWVGPLLPVPRGRQRSTVPNPLLELPIGEPRDVTGPGSTARHRQHIVPATLSRVVVNINDRVGGDNRLVALHGGLVGVAQDADGALRPVAGWHLAPAELRIDDVIDRMARDHETTPPRRIPAMVCPPRCIALYARLGTASLFGGGWRLVSPEERRIAFVPGTDVWLHTLFELADGRTIALVDLDWAGNTCWVLCRVTQDDTPGPARHRLVLADDPADVPVLGTSLAMLLDAAMDSGFDVAHLETGRLHELLTA